MKALWLVVLGLGWVVILSVGCTNQGGGKSHKKAFSSVDGIDISESFLEEVNGSFIRNVNQKDKSIAGQSKAIIIEKDGTYKEKGRMRILLDDGNENSYISCQYQASGYIETVRHLRKTKDTFQYGKTPIHWKGAKYYMVTTITEIDELFASRANEDEITPNKKVSVSNTTEADIGVFCRDMILGRHFEAFYSYGKNFIYGGALYTRPGDNAVKVNNSVFKHRLNRVSSNMISLGLNRQRVSFDEFTQKVHVEVKNEKGELCLKAYGLMSELTLDLAMDVAGQIKVSETETTDNEGCSNDDTVKTFKALEEGSVVEFSTDENSFVFNNLEE
jgi:hypothetical protein